MRTLDRDRREILVSLFERKVPVTDDQGRLTGRHRVERAPQTPVLASVSAAKGYAQDAVFGQSLDYDRTVIVDDPGFDISESAVLWIDSWGSSPHELPFDEPWDYVVKKVARTPSYTAVAVKRVEVSA